MNQRRLRAIDNAIAGGEQAIAIIHIVVSDGESLLVKASEVGKEQLRSQHASCRDGRIIPRNLRIPQIAAVSSGCELKSRAGHTVVVSVHHSSVLNSAVGQ